MTENQKGQTGVVLRVPKPNLQIVVLGLIAVITIFQTFQLVRINAKAGSSAVKTVPATNNSGSSGAESNTDTPQSMVGGC